MEISLKIVEIMKISLKIIITVGEGSIFATAASEPELSKQARQQILIYICA